MHLLWMTNLFSKVTDQTAVAETTLTVNFWVKNYVSAPFQNYFAKARTKQEDGMLIN